MAAPNQQPPPQGQGGGFDINKLFKPSSNPMNLNMGVAPPTPTTSNLTTSPSFPAQSSTPPPGPPYLTPSSSYPPPTGPYPFHNPHYLPYPPIPQHQQLNRGGPQISYPPPSPPSNPSTGSDILMTFFGNQNQSISPSPSSSDFSNPPVPSNPSNMGSSGGPSPVRLLSSKLPKGRHLIGSNLVYDIDKRMQGEVQPQLEVTPITKYASDPGLVLGRQIAVNRSYICYGLKLGNIRILNINTALRSLLRGHTQRVTDMAFFAEDVHLLASASVDGRVFVWKINEGPDDEDKPQILGKVVIAIQIVGGESIHPRVCWHPHKQEILMVAVGNRIFKIDTMKVGKTGGFTAEEPLNCSIDKLIDGVQFVGKHNGDITELSMCQWLTTRLASASVDGEVKIWDDRRPFPLAVIRPHDGYPVNSATFLTAPHRPDHIVLITGGPLNREVKIWVCYCEDGWLLPTEAEAWRCTQTLELKSSETKFEDSFFNQVVALPRAGLFLLANAKKNAIYAVHIDYGPNPAATCMDYLAEFTVTMPILSLTGTSESLPGGDHSVQVYCVQTQAIQQYALDLSRCFPPSLGNMELEKTDSSNIAGVYEASNSDGSATLESSQGSKCNEITVSNSIPTPPFLSCNSEIAQTSYPERLASSELTTLPEVSTSSLENKSTAVLSNSTAEHIHSASPPSPRLSQHSSGFRNQSNADHGSEENKAEMPFSGDSLQKSDKDVQNDISMVPNQPVAFKHPTHLVTPSEILSTVTSSSDNVSQGMNARDVKTQDVVINNDAESVEVEVKVVGETGAGQDKATENPREAHIIEEKREKAFFSQASDLGIQMAKDYNVETYNVEEAQRVGDVGVVVPSEKPAVSNDVEEQGVPKAAKIGDSEIPSTASQPPAAKSKKQKGKTSQVSGPSPSQSPYNSIESSNEPVCSSGAPSSDALPHILAMQDMIEQLVNMQKETQKQMNTVVSSSVNKEGKRLETSLGKNIEKVIKANTDALWARFQEENAKHEKLEKERTHQITNLITNCINKDLPATLEKTLKKEIATVGPVVARAITPVMEKSVASAITESFQKGVGEKAVNQLEKSVISKLEATVARQIQAQFQTSGKQALQDSLRSCLEASVVPAFEMSCKSMFEQIDAAFQKGLVKHTSAAQQQFENSHSQLAIALRDAIGSATSITQTLTGELADGQRKLLAAIAAASVNSPAGNPLVTQLSNGPLAGLHEMQPEVQFDPTKELARLIAERKYDEAFTAALHRSDVTIVSWLCSQVDLQGILAMAPVPLNQGVLLALLQQLACDISNETAKKLSWMTDVAVAINPSDPVIAMHVRPIFDQVYQILSHQRNLPTTSASEASSIRLLTHVINSVLMSYK